jgi:putative flippase GtrA
VQPAPESDQAPPKALSARPQLVRFIRFLVVGGLNTAFGYAVFTAIFLLTSERNLAVIIGNVVGAAFNYFTTGRLVFANKGLRAFLPFVLGYVLVLVVNLALVNLFVSFGLTTLIAGLVALPFCVLVSYAYNSLVVFRTVRD